MLVCDIALGRMYLGTWFSEKMYWVYMAPQKDVLRYIAPRRDVFGIGLKTFN